MFPLSELEEFLLIRDLECLSIKNKIQNFLYRREHLLRINKKISKDVVRYKEEVARASRKKILCERILSRPQENLVGDDETLILNYGNIGDKIDLNGLKLLTGRDYHTRLVKVRNVYLRSTSTLTDYLPAIDRIHYQKSWVQKEHGKVEKTIEKLRKKIDDLQVIPKNIERFNNDRRKNIELWKEHLSSPFRPQRGDSRVQDSV
tara:strand:- start:1071 stop:1682 length:612 start_codon:yes stop_codon:yes gene_type:complete